MRHLAFCVDSVEQTVNELAEVGIECEPVRVDDYTGKKMTFFMIRTDCRWNCTNNYGREKSIYGDLKYPVVVKAWTPAEADTICRFVYNGFTRVLK